jgi:hypothetical protein
MGPGATYDSSLTLLLRAFADYSFIVVRWLVPLPWNGIEVLPAAGWILALALVFWAMWPRTGTGAETAGPARLLFLALVVSTALLGWGTAIGRAGAGLHEAERYLTALYPPFVLLVLRAYPTGPNSRALARLGPLLLAGWLLYQAVRVGYNARQLRGVPPMTEAQG